MLSLLLRVLMLGLLGAPIYSQWIKQNVDTKASFRGLSVVNDKIVWASGTGGTVIRTVDGGKTWNVMTVPGAEKLDFRDIEAFDANTAYILSIGNGENSRIYKTIDGGAAWNLQYKNDDPKKFFDAMACPNQQLCLAVSDPVGGKFPVLMTADGEHWVSGERWESPDAVDGEAAFAASGTCLIALGPQPWFLVSGGARSSVYMFFLGERGQLVTHRSDAPITSGSSGSGIFSIAMFDKSNGVIVGGDYEKPDEHEKNLAFTTDLGQTWRLGTGLTGYRSGVTYIDKNTIIAVGTNGTDLSSDAGKTWQKIGNENLNVVQAKGKGAVWAAGPNGLVVKLK